LLVFSKHQHHWQADCFRVLMVFMMAAFNLLAQWHGFQPDASGMIHPSIAVFSLWLAPLVVVPIWEGQNPRQ